MHLYLGGRYLSSVFLYLACAGCLILLLSMHHHDPECSPQTKENSDGDYPENNTHELKQVGVQPNATVVSINLNSSITFERTYPYGTKRNDTNPMIFITSWTDVQPNQKEWFAPVETEISYCAN